MEISHYPRHVMRIAGGQSAQAVAEPSYAPSGKVIPGYLSNSVINQAMPESENVFALERLAQEISRVAQAKTPFPANNMPASLNSKVKDLSPQVQVPHKPATNSQSLNVSVAKAAPRIELQPGDRRMEIYPHGAKVLKDPWGKVLEVLSSEGQCLRLRYSNNTSIDGFVLFDTNGSVSAFAEKDADGYALCNASGHILAMGQDMVIGPQGSLTIAHRNGELWAVDMRYASYLERKILRGFNQSYYAITAIFAYDGFRMITQFANVGNQNKKTAQNPGANPVLNPYADPAVIWCKANEQSGTGLRFYGRDGSMIEFEVAFAPLERLRYVEPTRTHPTGSQLVEPRFSNYKEPQTAWDAVNAHYVRDWFGTDIGL